MLESIRESVRKFLSGSSPYDKAVETFIRDLQKILIQSDVNIKLVSQLTTKIKQRLNNEKPPTYADKREWFIKIVYEELANLFGGDKEPDVLPSKIPYVIMLVGIQGSGKTTTAGKLAYFYKRKSYRVGVIAADIYRPAAYEQLRQLSLQASADFYGEQENKNPTEIAMNGIKQLLSHKCQVIIIDTAGRHGYGNEEYLLQEMKSMSDAVKPDEVILVLDASIGQKAYDLASRFHNVTPIGSIIITKMDGTAKGGGALSAAAITGASIKFIGTGEKIDELEVFNPRRYVSRILGMGDIESILERLSSIEEYEEIEEKMEEVLQGKGKITLRDIYKQIKAVKKMGPLSKVLDKIPGFNMLPKLPSEDEIKMSEEKMNKWLSIINSMTYEELDNPSIVDKNRVRRIARGAGVRPEEVRELLKQYELTNRALKTLRKKRDIGKLLGTQ
ncbi:signal recognition particle protein [Sulfolobales archaeon HS-7]|nr:signal recognition particle protein [Sulfolobales archaeon HS-7]